MRIVSPELGNLFFEHSLIKHILYAPLRKNKGIISMSQIINPHAMFFEKVFSRKDVAVDLVKNYLPKEIINDLDLSTVYP